MRDAVGGLLDLADVVEAANFFAWADEIRQAVDEIERLRYRLRAVDDYSPGLVDVAVEAHAR